MKTPVTFFCWLLIAVLMFMISTAASAQELIPLEPRAFDDPTPTFASTPWGSSTEVVRKNFTDAGFEPSENDGADLYFTGSVLHHDVSIVARMAPDHGLVKVRVAMAAEEHELFDVYKEMRSLLTEKYGKPDRAVERYASPYERGDGYETQAISLGKATVMTYWEYRGGPRTGTVGVEITDALNIDVAYESMRWTDELRRRQRASTKAF